MFYLCAMNKALLFASALSVFFFASCGSKTETSTEAAADSAAIAPAPVALTNAEIGAAYFVEGDTIAPENALPVDSVDAALIAGHPGDFKVKAKVEAVCQAKGCWMKVVMPSGKKLHIKFKDYAFFVPKDIVGQEVIFSGKAFNDTISVEQLKHYAEDEGQPKAEIAKISAPEISPSFEATGVLIAKPAGAAHAASEEAGHGEEHGHSEEHDHDDAK
jgi:hypothetical protein